MKRALFFAFILTVVGLSVYAQDFTVESVQGRVQRDNGGKMVDVKVGDVLNESSKIRTPVNSSVVLREGKNVYTIPAGRNGKIGDLISADAKAGGNVATTDTDAVTRTAGQVSTASARASIATKATVEDEDVKDKE